MACSCCCWYCRELATPVTPFRDGCLVRPFVCVRDTERCGPLSRCASSTALDCERLLVGGSSIGLLGPYEGSEERIGGCGADRAGVRAANVGTPGGRGAGRPGTSVVWLKEGLGAGRTVASVVWLSEGLDTKLMGPGTLRGIGGAARGCSKEPS